MEYSLHDLLIRSAYKGLTIQLDDGSFPKGHDGPWYNDDTYIRTTAHWTMLTLKAYGLTGDKEFLKSSVRALNYLTGEHSRPYNYAFHCNNSIHGGTRSNGLIGQAWIIEPLITAGIQLEEDKYLSVAREVILLHPYNHKSCTWSAIEIDGADLGEYKTLNQQIWFGAMALKLGINTSDENILCMSRDFFNNLPKKINQFDGGIIDHTYTNDRFLVKRWTRNLFRKANKNGEYSLQKTLSISYMPFLLYGLAYIIDTVPKDIISSTIKSSFLTKAVRYIENDFPYGFLENPGSYRWSYNPVGIEMAYILQVLSDLEGNYLLQNDSNYETRITKWLKKQFEGYYDFERYIMNRNTNDPEILSSRLYEAVRLKDYRLEFAS